MTGDLAKFEQEFAAAMKETEREIAAGKKKSDATLALWRLYDQLDLAALENDFAGGDRFALMMAICICANSGLAMPEWVVRGYTAGFYAVQDCRAASWDEAFGRPYPKGVHLGKEAYREGLCMVISSRVRDIRSAEPDTPIDDGLFERVGEEFSIGKTKCNELYYKYVKRQQKYNEYSAAKMRIFEAIQRLKEPQQ